MVFTVFSLFLSLACAAPKLRPNLVPEPVSLTLGDGEFTLLPSCKISYDKSVEGVVDDVNYVARIIRVSTGYVMNIVDSVQDKGIILQKADKELQNDEAYELHITKDAARIVAKTGAGFFYGIQTLLQLLPYEIYSKKTVYGTQWVAPVCDVIDYPRFPWRGVMLDTCRRFFDADSIKRLLYGMAQQKLNKFHWHINDDSGWRLEVKKYPNLIIKGSSCAYKPKPWDKNSNDGVRYGPFFYTQEEVRGIVEYAKKLHIDIIPEIEMPAHSLAAVASYPWLCCTGQQYEPSPFGASIEILCAGNDQVFQFLRDVLDEVMDMFPYEVVHIGGDEATKTRWGQCEKCQKRMKDEGLHNLNELQSWFIKQIVNYVMSKGRRAIGWDEIMEGGLADGAMVMSWRGNDSAKEATDAGHDVVMTPTEAYYLDYRQFPVLEPFEYICCLKPIYTTYNYEPTAKVDPKNVDKVVGVQGNVWTEYIWGEDPDMDYKTYPRSCSVAETGWTPKDQKNWQRHVTVLVREHLKRLETQYINTAPVSLGKKAYWNSDTVTNEWKLKEWVVTGAVGTAGPYDVAFIYTGGNNGLKIRNVKLLFDDEIVAESEGKEGLASWDLTGTNFFSLETKDSGDKVEVVKVRAEICGDGGNDTEGEVIVYYTSSNEIW